MGGSAGPEPEAAIHMRTTMDRRENLSPPPSLPTHQRKRAPGGSVCLSRLQCDQNILALLVIGPSTGTPVHLAHPRETNRRKCRLKCSDAATQRRRDVTQDNSPESTPRRCCTPTTTALGFRFSCRPHCQTQNGQPISGAKSHRITRRGL